MSPTLMVVTSIGRERRNPKRARPSSRETLIKLSLSTANAATVSADEAEDTSDDEWIRALQQENAAGIVFGRDGAGGALEQAMRADRALLPEGRQRAPASGCGADAAHLLFAAMFQPVGPGGGRGAVRLGGDAQLRGHRFGERTGAGREYGMQVPPSTGRTPVRRADAGSGEPALAEQGSTDHDGDHRGRDHHSRPHFD